MRVESTTLRNVHLVRPDVHLDERGEFWRSYCRQTLVANSVEFEVQQSNVSVNPCRHTLRGFHYQRSPSTEQKILTVLAGAIHAVIVDLQPGSSTFLEHEAFRFEAGDRSSLVVAVGCATGFLTLVDQTIVHYQMSDIYRPDCYDGFRYDDPVVGVKWPDQPAVISERDLGFPPLDPGEFIDTGSG